MARGSVRIARIQDALRMAELDAVVCTLPTNVLMLSGYWPVVGSTLAVATRDGKIVVLAPVDERELAEAGWATRVETFQTGSLTQLESPVQAVRDVLARAFAEVGVERGRIGYEGDDAYESSTYAATYLFSEATRDMLVAAAPFAAYTTATETLTQLRSTLAPEEIARVRVACEVATSAFESGAAALHTGLHEPDIAAAFAMPLSVLGLHRPDVERAGGFTYCMSGPNAARAGSLYARTRDRVARDGDLVLVHCNSYVDGYWTDITRTYCMGEPDERIRAMYEAVFAARAAALEAIQVGTRASEVDRAAREVLTQRGFGPNFTHGLGHNVGFSAINADFPPRLHPASTDCLEVGMIFNIEPAIYIEGYGGIRHCDVVVLDEGSGAEILTPFQASLDQLIVRV
jgi:Xaa-Pro aminopeptidase